MAMTPEERKVALTSMREVSRQFYLQAVHIGNHPFIEFAGLMNEYIGACTNAHKCGIDFSDCNTHTGQKLPLAPFQVSYLNEKLECIFMGTSVVCEVEGSD